MFDEETKTVRADLDWCHGVVADVSRTFALTIAELEPPLSHEICVGYLLCRIPDTIEDSTRLPPAEQRRLLDRYGEALAPAAETSIEEFRRSGARWIPDDPGSEWETVANSPRIVRTFRRFPEQSREVIRPAVRELVGGMSLFVDRYADAGGLRLRTVEELEEYCWYVAGTVGTLVTGLLEDGAPRAVRERLWATARSFALLLQLVNVAKDVAVDYREENNVYVPGELLAAEGLSAADIADPANAAAFVPVIESLVDRAAGYLDDAQRWIEAMPLARGNSLAAWTIPFLLAVGTLRELRCRPEDVVATGSVKISRAEVGAVLARFAGDDTPALGALRRQMEQAPLHER
jgi:farnesyl-diphosphate farnesyltransferase